MTINEKISNELFEIKKELSHGDNVECSEKLQLAKETVSRYLNGHVKHADTGLAILKFFRKRIEERKKQLA